MALSECNEIIINEFKEKLVEFVSLPFYVYVKNIETKTL